MKADPEYNHKVGRRVSIRASQTYVNRGGRWKGCEQDPLYAPPTCTQEWRWRNVAGRLWLDHFGFSVLWLARTADGKSWGVWSAEDTLSEPPARRLFQGVQEAAAWAMANWDHLPPPPRMVTTIKERVRTRSNYAHRTHTSNLADLSKCEAPPCR